MDAPRECQGDRPSRELCATRSTRIDTRPKPVVASNLRIYVSTLLLTFPRIRIPLVRLYEGES